jgi:hypothetical protein
LPECRAPPRSSVFLRQPTVQAIGCDGLSGTVDMCCAHNPASCVLYLIGYN